MAIRRCAAYVAHQLQEQTMGFDYDPDTSIELIVTSYGFWFVWVYTGPEWFRII
jgi:hypothetical protein